MPNDNLSFMEYVWAPFVGLFWWFINRLTRKIDEIEKEKSSNNDVDKLGEHIRLLDKRIDELGHTTVPRPEYKTDLLRTDENISELHGRANDLEKRKQDRIRRIKIHEEAKNGDR